MEKKTAEERLLHDIQTGIFNRAAEHLAGSRVSQASALAGDTWLAREVMKELRIRWTIIERPRKQRTIRQES